uniref:Acyl-CoA dehydrogenase 6 n=1 Tax=Parascaris univalens TaxID=6257 RepID=A0A915AX70_PARUN
MPAVSPKAAPQITQHILYGARHLQFRQALGQFIDKEINPHVDEWEKNRRFPAKSLFKKLGRLGILGVNKPHAYGGLGLDFSYNIAIAEEMGRVHCAAIPMAVAVQTDMATPALADFGNDALKREFLRPTIEGDMVSCIGVSEACAGSDVAAIRTRAHWHGSDVIINGSKQWITNGNQADWICLLVNTNDNQLPHRNKSLICVRLDEPGVHRSKSIEKLGMHSSDTAEIYFDSVRVPSRNIIGEEGRGFVYQMLQFQDERLIAVAVLLEPMQRIIDMTIDYTRQRRIFGKSVLENQVVHYRLAELQTEIEAVRSLLYRAVMEKLSGSDVTLLASMGKLKAGRLARTITDSCLQFWGGNGYTWDNAISRYHRDFRLFSIAAGCDEVMLNIICKYMHTI